MISRTNVSGCNTPSAEPARVLAAQVWRLWCGARVTIWRGAGVLGVACALVGCRAGAPAEWTMERLAMSEAWYEQSQAHRGQDANFQEGWRSGFADGRASFSEAWAERDPAQFEAFIWEKREQAQAKWREGYDAGFTSARSQKDKHSHHASLFGTPHPSTHPSAETNASVRNSQVLNSGDPAAAAPALASPTLLEPVPSQTWDAGGTGYGTPAAEPTVSTGAVASPILGQSTEAGDSSASSQTPAPPSLTLLPGTVTPQANPTSSASPSPTAGTNDPATTLDAAIRRSLGTQGSDASIDAGPLPATTPSGKETTVEPLTTPPGDTLPINSQPTPAPTLELPFDDDDVARRTSPIITTPAPTAFRSSAPRVGSWQAGQTVTNPYFASPASDAAVATPATPTTEQPAAATTSAVGSTPVAAIPTTVGTTPAGGTIPTTAAFPRTAHREFLPTRPIPTTATLPPAVQVQHTANGDTAAEKVAPPLPQRLPLRPRK